MKVKVSLFEEDIKDIADCDFIPWEKLKDKTVFITGGTGLIGTVLIKGLIAADKEKNLGLKVIALVRDIKKADQKFENESEESLSFITGCVEDLPQINEKIDYIIHGASCTASRQFVEQPVETIRTSVIGTENVLKLAKEKKVNGFVYLSSMEVYGYPKRGHKIKEDEMGAFSPMEIRNSYPVSKQLCESLTCAYADEYNLPCNIIRLTQTFGAGISENDNRIFAYFVRCATEKKDIILKTKGETERSYLYTTDAVTAILTVMMAGKRGQAYNAASEKTYCSIAEMARIVAGDAGITVKYEIADEKENGFAKTLYMNLDTSLLKELGWKPKRNEIGEMFKRAIVSEEKMRYISKRDW